MPTAAVTLGAGVPAARPKRTPGAGGGTKKTRPDPGFTLATALEAGRPGLCSPGLWPPTGTFLHPSVNRPQAPPQVFLCELVGQLGLGFAAPCLQPPWRCGASGWAWEAGNTFGNSRLRQLWTEEPAQQPREPLRSASPPPPGPAVVFMAPGPGGSSAKSFPGELSSSTPSGGQSQPRQEGKEGSRGPGEAILAAWPLAWLLSDRERHQSRTRMEAGKPRDFCWTRPSHTPGCAQGHGMSRDPGHRLSLDPGPRRSPDLAGHSLSPAGNMMY
ncbi:collagen alpha-1(XI) chain-like isoform X1 [Symphalangus syndactylus]|uniref:collagen alpha-1(XI) chain-like isoform X1 n=1 Tax=Symphalangus syndactylus TaxID=9590 RepID=UPI0024413DC9|nr:collagen alpha-1(XI) chain-like isoform X1 [Symphalangus syndactylus]